MKALCNFENDLKYAFCKRAILINRIFSTSKTIVANLSWYDYTELSQKMIFWQAHQ